MMSQMSSETGSLVQYLYIPGGIKPYKCGYCKSQDTSYTQGVWGFKMTCQDYQNLVDRGFQRSGNFVYRPVMKKTCCPQYVIRMDVTKFKLSKSQKAAIKKFKRYLVEGSKPTQEMSTSADVVASDREEVSGQAVNVQPTDMKTDDISLPSETVTAPSLRKKLKKPIRAGVGPDPSKPSCKKAKVIRKEKKEQRILAQLQHGVTTPQQPLKDKSHLQPDTGTGSDTGSGTGTFSGTGTGNDTGTDITGTSTGSGTGISTGAGSQECTPSTECYQDSKYAENLQEILAFPKDDECVHRFKSRLVQITGADKNYTDTYSESFRVFQKFQTVIHKESEEESGEKQFDEFLINSPLIYDTISDDVTIKYGTYHQQYILDDKIFAVGVLDILPKGVLCEYLYYDPDCRFIAPGVITALLEISLTQELYLKVPEMKYYYMGFYVQSCPKMNYKSKYSASHLLCPETHTYVPLGECIPKLKASPYSRLAALDVETPQEGSTEEELGAVPVWMGSSTMPYGQYKSLVEGDPQLMEEYVDLVGVEVAANMRILLRRASID